MWIKESDLAEKVFEGAKDGGYQEFVRRLFYTAGPWRQPSFHVSQGAKNTFDRLPKCSASDPWQRAVTKRTSTPKLHGKQALCAQNMATKILF